MLLVNPPGMNGRVVMGTMKSFYYSALALSFFSVAVRGQNAYIDSHTFSQAIGALPFCAQRCLGPIFLELPCTNISTLGLVADCLCSDVRIQEQASGCIQKNCTFPEQVVTAVEQQALCQGYPIESKAQKILITVVIVTALSFPFVLLRIWSRTSIAGMFGPDDWAMIAGAVGIICVLGLEVPMAQGGWGNHIWTLNVTKLAGVLKLFYVTQLFYVIVQCATKLSILLFYLRIFPQRWFVNSTKVLIVVVVLSDFIFIFILAFQCDPIAAIWDKSINAKCFNQEAIIYTGAAISILEHIAILIIPIPCISALKVGRGKRISLFVMFSIGTFTLVAGLIRLKYISRFGTSTDATFDNGDVEIWSAIEISVALICSCLPALRPLLMRYVPILFGSGDSSDGKYREGSEEKKLNSKVREQGYGVGSKVKETKEKEKEGDGDASSGSSVMGLQRLEIYLESGLEGRGGGDGGFERKFRLEGGNLKEVTKNGDQDSHGRGNARGSSSIVVARESMEHSFPRWSSQSSNASDVELVIMKQDEAQVDVQPSKELEPRSFAEEEKRAADRRVVEERRKMEQKRRMEQMNRPLPALPVEARR